MSDTALNSIIRYGTNAQRVAFTPNPAVGSQVLYIWYETDNVPDTYVWNGAAWVQINAASSGDVSGPAASIDAEIALFSGITGKIIKRATGSGLVRATSGVYGVSTVATADVDNNAVDNTKLADMAALTAKVRAANSSGDPSDVALTDGHAAKRVGTSIVSGGFGPASISALTTGAAATYTVPAGIYRLRFMVLGGGGGGGGVDSGVGQSGC